MSMFVNAITSNAFQTIAQNTDACVKIETGLKAIGRPAFTLIDKNTDKETRKYSATKELLYQLLCFGIYVAVIPPVFKNGGFKLFQKIFKNEGLPNFRSAKQMLSYYHLAHVPKERRMDPQYQKFWDAIPSDIVDITNKTKEFKDGTPLVEYLKNWKKDDITSGGKMFKLAKGSIELSSIVGSVIGLTILAPEISHLILHPIMNGLGMDKKSDKQEPQQTKVLDKKA